MSAFTSLLGSELLDKGGKKVPTTSLQDKVVGLYFSAHWCPPCRQFTPILSGIYQQLQKEKKAFEIVFISSDKDEKSFQEYFGSMPWKALPFGDDRKNSLGQTYQVRGIPALILLDPEGNTLTTDGREVISRLGAKGFPFGAKLKEEEVKKKMEEKAKAQALLAPKQAALGKEPEDGDGVVTIQINTPSGSKTQRRFYNTQNISDIEKYAAAFDVTLTSTPFCVRTNYPRPGVVFTESTQFIKDAFPATKRINLFIQKGVSSKPGKVKPVTSTPSTTSSSSTSAKPAPVVDLTSTSDWTCSTCTYLNTAASNAVCDVCGSPKM